MVSAPARICASVRSRALPSSPSARAARRALTASPLSLKDLHQPRGQLGAAALLFVLEEHESFAPRLLANPPRPVAQVAVAEVLAPEPQVAPVGGGDQGCCRLL